MNVFFLELWHDLREKRLAPVAVLLALAVVAVPAVMLKSSSETDPAPITPAKQTAGVDKLMPIELARSAKSSGLKAFDPKNPFKPGIRIGEPGSSVISRTGGSLAGSPSGFDAPIAGGAGGAGGGGGGGGGGGTFSQGGSGAPAPSTPRRRTARFTYVVDVTFVKNGRSFRRRGLRRLAMLPSQDAPLLLFLGVDSTADNAVFLVDSTLKAAGEGVCRPSPEECGVLSLGSGAEHEFTDAEDNSYGIRIDEIRRVSARRAARAARASSRASASVSRPRRRFVPPFLTDIETETTTGAER